MNWKHAILLLDHFRTTWAVDITSRGPVFWSLPISVIKGLLDKIGLLTMTSQHFCSIFLNIRAPKLVASPTWFYLLTGRFPRWLPVLYACQIGKNAVQKYLHVTWRYFNRIFYIRVGEHGFATNSLVPRVRVSSFSNMADEMGGLYGWCWYKLIVCPSISAD